MGLPGSSVGTGGQTLGCHPRLSALTSSKNRCDHEKNDHTVIQPNMHAFPVPDADRLNAVGKPGFHILEHYFALWLVVHLMIGTLVDLQRLVF